MNESKVVHKYNTHLYNIYMYNMYVCIYMYYVLCMYKFYMYIVLETLPSLRKRVKSVVKPSHRDIGPGFVWADDGT